MMNQCVSGVGLSLKREFFEAIITNPDFEIDFLEVAPENWLHFGGRLGRELRTLSERYPLVCHGLSLDIGGPSPLDVNYLKEMKTFFDFHEVKAYTEHLSYCGDTGHLYDLMPIPFTEEAVHYVADRIKQVQDILERPIGMENVSYYALLTNELTEAEFINAVVSEADCGLLFDVNNTYVNSINHQYNAEAFMKAMPTERMMYLHMAGHFDEADDLKIDTHGQDVKPQVWDLLDKTYCTHGLQPTLLERDFNIPPMEVLMEEVEQIRQAQQKWQARYGQ